MRRDLNVITRRTRKRESLTQMKRVVPSTALAARITPYAPESRQGHTPFALEPMLRIHFMQQWFTPSDPAMKETLQDMRLFQGFSGLNWDMTAPHEMTILRFRRPLEKCELVARILILINKILPIKGLPLRPGPLADAALISVPSSTKSVSGQHDLQLKQSQKGKRYYFSMEALIGGDTHSSLWRAPCAARQVASMRWSRLTPCCVTRRSQALGNTGYQGAGKRVLKYRPAPWRARAAGREQSG